MIQDYKPELSPASQAIVDAIVEWEVPECYSREIAVAVLRALAVRIVGADAIRQDVLDIAEELVFSINANHRESK